jgi:hypothetical protein
MATSLYTGESFYTLCEEARRQRKPILILLIRGKTASRPHRIAYNSLLRPEHVRTQLDSGFLIFGIYDRPQ